MKRLSSMKSLLIMGVLVAIIAHDQATFFATAYANETPYTAKGNKMKEPDTYAPYQSRDLEPVPPPTRMTDEQKLHLITVYKAVQRVIEKKSTLRQEEALFGEGEYFWPKDPMKPVKVSRSYSVPRMNIISLGFKRKDQKSIWSDVELFIHPQHTPDAVFLMNVPAEFFADFILDKSFAEEQPLTSIKRVNIFQFHHKNPSLHVTLQVEARDDVSSLQDKYPKNFHYLKITRTD